MFFAEENVRVVAVDEMLAWRFRGVLINNILRISFFFLIAIKILGDGEKKPTPVYFELIVEDDE